MTGSDRPAPKRSTWDAIAVFLERRTLVMLTLGFAAGCRICWSSTRSRHGCARAACRCRLIGFFSLATLSYSLKFLWAPLDRPHSVPVLTASRSSPLVDAGVPGRHHLRPVADLAALEPQTANLRPRRCVRSLRRVRLGDAGHRHRRLADRGGGEERQGVMAAAYQWGYRIAISPPGIAPLLMASRINWVAYAAMAVLMADRHSRRAGCAEGEAAPGDAAFDADATCRRSPRRKRSNGSLRLVLLLIGALSSARVSPVSSMLLQNSLSLVGIRRTLAGARKRLGPSGRWACSFKWLSRSRASALMVCAALPVPGAKTRPGVYFAGSYGEPLEDFFRRFAGSAG